MGMLGMRFFILSYFERKGMGFHEAFLPKKVELKGSCPISTAPGLIFYSFEREQRSVQILVPIDNMILSCQDQEELFLLYNISMFSSFPQLASCSSGVIWVCKLKESSIPEEFWSDSETPG
ncbi:hypothetical protein OIU85_016369 [Salix viminalis]|uniref:Uncharacterized protein n=1 Tax=Salix viminalis TaxID=40686 RepID=A0A9Q0V6Z1_SALVM|nr:hypothetical protein OIU85_016369 [Salix viminalis]